MPYAFSPWCGFLLITAGAPVATGVLVGIVGTRLSLAALARSSRSVRARIILALSASVTLFLIVWALASAMTPTQGDQTGIALRVLWLGIGLGGTLAAAGAVALSFKRRAEQAPQPDSAPDDLDSAGM